jgi:cell division protease FtsH
MSEEFGLMSYQETEGVKAYSEHTAQRIDEEVKRIVDNCYKEVEQLLEEKKELIEA